MPFVRQQNAVQLFDQYGMGDVIASGGVRMPRTDMVIVFPFKTSALVQYKESADVEQTVLQRNPMRPPTKEQENQMDLWTNKRTATIHSLHECGLILMLYYSRDRDEIFCRIAAEGHHLRKVAQMMKYRLELREQYLSAFAEFKQDYKGRLEVNYADRCVVNHLYKVHTDRTDADQGARYPSSDAIFRTVDRISLIDTIIRQNGHDCAGIDMGQLMHDNDVLHYFPMHENQLLRDMDKDWFLTFASGSHIDKVRDYFGERIAMYFLFMAYLNSALIWPAVLGIGFWVYDTVRATPDNRTEGFVCLIMGLWAVLFVPFWRMKAAERACKWGTIGMKTQEEPTRPQFKGTCQVNPVTGRVDRYYPWSDRVKSIALSWSTILGCILVLFWTIGILMIVRARMQKHAGGRPMFMVVNAIMVEAGNILFTKLAKWLTDRENYRAPSEYSNSLMAKTVIFKFINCYSSLYYIAFFKAHHYLYGVEMKCWKDDCMYDLSMQLAVFLIVRCTFQNLMELGLPYFRMMWQNYQEGRTFHTSIFENPLTVMPDLSQAEKQSKKEEFDLYDDMDETLILYGYATLFVVACPWIPALALAMNVLECFLDQKKLIFLYRRPMPTPAANLEPWDTAFDIFGILAMLTNALLIVFSARAFDSEFVHGLPESCNGIYNFPYCLDKHSQMIIGFLMIEHFALFARLVLTHVYPELPMAVRLLRMQQDVVLHKHMNLGGDEEDQEARASAMLVTQVGPPFVHENDDDDIE
jgi:hypothetical protein